MGLGGSRGNPRDASQQYTTASWDQHHNFTANFVYDLSFGQGKKLGGGIGRVADAVIGGWQANGVLTFHSGRSFALGTRYGVGYMGSIHPDIVLGKEPNAPPPGGRTTNRWFDTSAVTSPLPYTIGTVPNATNVGPGQRNLDLSLFKTLRVTERYRLQLRFEGMNIANTPFFGNPGSTQGDATFGQTNSASGERSVQIAIRFVFG